uniref:Uncharacterized protein n=1 Tax=Acrobeloides nanus TaxID=290746 RepID=A0A914ECM0_9BILA
MPLWLSGKALAFEPEGRCISTSVYTESTIINTTSVNITLSANTTQPGGHGTIIKIDNMNMFALILFVLFIY